MDGPEATVIDVYRRHGPAWVRLRGKTLIERPWLDRFCALVAPGGEVLDIGCGAGDPLACELSRRGFAVTGVDAAAPMLELFAANLPGAPAHLADMRTLDLGRRFAGLLAWDSFFHLSPVDQRPMFARFQAHALPGAPLMFTSGGHEGSAVGELEGEPLYHGSLGPEEYHALLDKADFDLVAHVEADPDCGHRTIWLARQRG